MSLQLFAVRRCVVGMAVPDDLLTEGDADDYDARDTTTTTGEHDTGGMPASIDPIDVVDIDIIDNDKPL